MNLSLVDPFAILQDYPETLSNSLHYGHSTCLHFNRKGDLLASGRLDGTVVLFDVETGGLARILRGHTRQVQSLSWSRCGRFLLSGSHDWKAILWDLEDGSRKRTIRFEAPIYIAELHPFNHDIFVAALYEDQPFIVDMSGPKIMKYPLSSIPRRTTDEAADDNDADEKHAKQDARQMTLVTAFDATGEFVITGTTKGWLNIISTSTHETVHSTRLTKSLITFVRVSASGRQLLVNSRDRTLRTIHMPVISDDTPPEDIEIEVEHKFQDVVNRLSWNHVAFSPTGEYICASTYKDHDVYVWERTRGSLVKILEGPKEELNTVEWHPSRPLIAAVGLDTGRIYIWATNHPQRWSALAPDFRELEGSLEYIEREDEFDYQDRDALTKRRLDNEDEEVDVITIEPTRADDEEAGFTMPVLLEIEESSSDDDVKVVGPTAATSTKRGTGDGIKKAATKKKRKMEEL